MFFSAYVGGDTGEARWRAAVRIHAARLGMQPVTVSRRLTRAALLLSWMANRPLEPATRVRASHGFVFFRPFGQLTPEDMSANEAQLARALDRSWNRSGIDVLVDTHRQRMTVSVPPATPEQLCWARIADGYVFADDVRVFALIEQQELDERAVYALLQYGLIPAPLTIFRRVSRVPGGYLFSLTYPTGESTCTPMRPPEHVRGPALRAEDPVQWVGETLDALLVRLPPRPVLYFSGGVDSALLACRLVALGRRDVQLVNYAFAQSDEESRLAHDIAVYLGLSCVRVDDTPARVADVLERIGTEYSFPFGDVSTAPTNMLVQQSPLLADPGATVIEGTGADGAFGLASSYPAWRRVYAVPPAFRSGVAGAFRGTRLWKSDRAPARLAAFTARSASLPIELAVIAKNPLDGIAYRTPPAVRAELAATLMRPVDALASAGEETRLSLLDMMMVCAGTMAAKSFDPLRKRGFSPLYPYLDPAFVHGASCLSPAQKCANGVSKSTLKALVSRTLPHAWVYRPKSGFTPPYRELFASAPLQAYLRSVVLDPGNPLLQFCHAPAIRVMVERAARRDTLLPGVCDFLWTVAFASGWIRSALGPAPPQLAAC